MVHPAGAADTMGGSESGGTYKALPRFPVNHSAAHINDPSRERTTHKEQSKKAPLTKQLHQ